MNFLQWKHNISIFFLICSVFLLSPATANAGAVTIQVNPTGNLNITEGSTLTINISVIKPVAAANCQVDGNAILASALANATFSNGATLSDLTLQNFGQTQIITTATGTIHKGKVVLYAPANDGLDPGESVSGSAIPQISGNLANGEPCVLSSTAPIPFNIEIIDTEPPLQGNVNIDITSNKSFVKEGDTATVTVKFTSATSVVAGSSCDIILSLSGTGSATFNHDFTESGGDNLYYNPSSDGASKTLTVTYHVTRNDGFDPGETIAAKLSFSHSGSQQCGVSNHPVWPTISIIDTDVVPHHLTTSFIPLKTEIQEGSSKIDIATAGFKLPANVNADANCNAGANIRVVGGTAKSGVDFKFTPVQLRFKHGDGNSKTEKIILDILDGLAGDGDKTVELEATFISVGTQLGNSCPLATDDSKKITITIKDRAASNLTGSLETTKKTVQEGSGISKVANIKFKLPVNSEADANCKAVAQVNVVGGTAKSGVDFSFTPTRLNFSQGDGNSKIQAINLNALSGVAGDGDKTVVLEATFTSNGGAAGNSCLLVSASPQKTVIIIKDTAAKNLTGILEKVKTTLQEGSGLSKVANVTFKLPVNSEADANCKAVAQVNVVGGKAKSGVDFSFTPTRLNFSQGDGNSKIQAVNLNALSGVAGDGDKTVVLEATFTSDGGGLGNSCPLASTRLARASTQKMVITIKDTPLIRPRVEVKLHDVIVGSNKTSELFPVKITQTPSRSKINCGVRVELIPSNLKGLMTISPTRFSNTGGNATINIIKRVATDQLVNIQARLTVNNKVCDSAGNTSAKITIKGKAILPSASISASATSVREKDNVKVTYRFTGNISSCRAINPIVVNGKTTANQNQYVLDTSIDLLKNPDIAVKILKQDPVKEKLLVLGAIGRGCELDVNNTVSIRIQKREVIIHEPEKLNTATCSALKNKVGISGSGVEIDKAVIRKLSGNDKSYYISNCKSGTDARNFEPEEIASQTNAVLGAANRQLRNVHSRLDNLRLNKGQRGIDVSDAKLNIQGSTISVGLLGGAAGDDENELLRNSRWGLFANGEYAFGKKDRGNDTIVTTGDRNFDFNSTGLTIGADYRFSGEKMIAGAALGYKNFDIDFSTQSGGVNTKGYNLSLYGTYLLSEKSYIDAVLGYGKDSLNSSRPVNNDGSGNLGAKTTFAIGKPDASELTFSVGGGYEFNQGEWSLSPYGRVDFTKGSIDAYTELPSHSSAATSMFSIDKQNIESLTSTLGIKASRVISTSSGVFVPNASIEWKHEFKERGAISGQSLFIKNNPSLNLSPQFNEAHSSGFDKDYYNIGVGVSAVFPKGRSAYLNLESRQGDSSIKDNAVKAGFRWEF